MVLRCSALAFVTISLLALTGCDHPVGPPGRSILGESRVDPGVGVGMIKLGMPLQTLQSRYGNAAATVTAQGTEVTYADQGLRVIAVTSTGREQPLVAQIICGLPREGTAHPFSGQTAEGVGLGTASDTATKLLGTPDQQDRTHMSYTSKGLWLALRDGVVTQMIVVPAKGAPGSPPPAPTP